jgi:4-amino-4-deoxy-L-arabinose transferase-like glycosyltransferase
MRQTFLLSLLAGLYAACSAAALVNPGLSHSSLPNGPGLTLDESFNIDQGVRLARAFGEYGPLLWLPENAARVFSEPEHLPDHPPLGRFILGTAHEWLGWLVPGVGQAVHNVAAARLGSALAFGLTVLILTEFCHRRFGAPTAITAALLLSGTPMLVGHARLAALETCTNLAWTAAMIPLLAWWTKPKPPSTTEALLSGACWGLLLITKVQGILLPPAVLLWSLLLHRQRALRPLAAWLAAGLMIAFVGWPWLWQNPLEHTLQYLGRTNSTTSNRSVLYCWYLGTRYEDRLVPWHYPWVLLLCSLPALTVAGCGLRILLRCRPERPEWLLLLISAMPLVVFSIPGVPVYDGVRLFLPSCAGIAVFAARGWAELMTRFTSGRFLAIAVPTLLLLLPLPWTLQPFAINQYGMLCGGNRGAAALGLEACFWNDSLNSSFWEQVPRGSVIHVAPVSHPFQLSDLELLVPVVSERNIQLKPYLYEEAGGPPPERLLLLHRLADLRPELRRTTGEWREEVRVELSGVPLARLLRRRAE